jgi:hypothetical protein
MLLEDKHQHPRFDLRLDGQRHMHSHLVSVEVCVKSRTYQRMKLHRLAFNEGRLKSLHSQDDAGSERG